MFREDFYKLPSTLPQGFQKLRENLEITGLQAETVSTRQQNVREAVEREMQVLDTFLTGSYKRSTMIAPLSEADIDIFVVLHSSYYSSDGQASLLEKVKYVLKKTYPKTPDISRDGQAVTISFTDFKVDVVPAFNRRGGGFLIPNTLQNEWISTDPREHITIWTNANKAHNDDLVPLIKMVKAWNKKNGSPFISFHLECLILHVLTNIRIDSFPSGVRYVFDKARKAVQSPVADLAGYNANVGKYLNTQDKLDDVVSRLETAYTRAVKAEECATKGNTEDAYYYWRLIFGVYFPAYG
jgi:Second Messenger Oligonucleotide or Dinucleotide Synthetase domain